MMTPKEFASAVGRPAIAAALKKGVPAVGVAISRGHFPAAWYDALDRLAQARGIDCPRDLFNFDPRSDDGA